MYRFVPIQNNTILTSIGIINVEPIVSAVALKRWGKMLFKYAGTLIINHFSESDGEQTFLIQLREGNFGCRTSMHLNNTNNRCLLLFRRLHFDCEQSHSQGLSPNFTRKIPHWRRFCVLDIMTSNCVFAYMAVGAFLKNISQSHLKILTILESATTLI